MSTGQISVIMMEDLSVSCSRDMGVDSGPGAIFTELLELVEYRQDSRKLARKNIQILLLIGSKLKKYTYFKSKDLALFNWR